MRLEVLENEVEMVKRGKNGRRDWWDVVVYYVQKLRKKWEIDQYGKGLDGFGEKQEFDFVYIMFVMYLRYVYKYGI